MAEDAGVPAEGVGGPGGGGGFCRDLFFNATVSWNTDDPDLTLCFRKTALIWVPCAAFWIILPFHLRNLFKTPSASGRFVSYLCGC